MPRSGRRPGDLLDRPHNDHDLRRSRKTKDDGELVHVTHTPTTVYKHHPGHSRSAFGFFFLGEMQEPLFEDFV